jgi:hypothetical protein
MLEPTALRNPKRVATPSIRGYFYQFLCTLQRWLDLNENEILWCEGNEDIDLLIASQTVVEEQIKHLATNLTDASGTITKTLWRFAQGFKDNHSKGLNSIHVFRTTATLNTPNPEHQPTYEWLQNQQALSEELVELIFQNIYSKAVKSAESASIEALMYIESKSLKRAFLESCTWSFQEMDYKDIHTHFMEKVRSDHRCNGLDPKAVADAALAKVCLVSSDSDLRNRVLSRYSFDCLTNDLLIDKQMKTYHKRSDNGERIVVVYDRDGLYSAVTIRFESLDQARSNLQDKTDEIRINPKHAESDLGSILLESDVMQQHINQMDFDLFVAVGTVNSTKKAATKKKWLASKTIEMSSHRLARHSVIKASFNLKEILSRDNEQLEIGAITENDYLWQLGNTICNWSISLYDGDAKDFPLHCIASKIRCVFKWDSREYFAQQVSPEGLASVG